MVPEGRSYSQNGVMVNGVQGIHQRLMNAES